MHSDDSCRDTEQEIFEPPCRFQRTLHLSQSSNFDP